MTLNATVSVREVCSACSGSGLVLSDSADTVRRGINDTSSPDTTIADVLFKPRYHVPAIGLDDKVLRKCGHCNGTGYIESTMPLSDLLALLRREPTP